MNIIDLIVVFIIVLFGLWGMKKGLIKSLVSVVGMVLVFIISFILKDTIAEWLSLNLPFFSFTGSFKGATILNVVLYQLIAFFVVFSVLMTVYSLVMMLSGIADRIVNVTLVLALPSKIFGFILGVLEGIIISLILIVILSLPTFNFDLVRDSTIRKYLYNTSPFIGNFTKNTNESIEEIIDLKEKWDDDDDKEGFNLSCMEILLKHKVVNYDYLNKLILSEKLKVNKEKAYEIMDQYK